MRNYLFFLLLISAAAGCSDNNQTADAEQLFCDTVCNSDSFMFTGNHRLKPYVSITTENCTGDTITWSHDALDAGRQLHMGTTLDHLVRLNKSAINAYIKDTSYIWLSFNDCTNGRGYLLKLPFDKKESVNKMSSALNSFDKKFVLPDDLRAYADYSTIYVVDVNTGKTAEMTFKEEYKINWNKIHETIDSVNITHNRIFVQLLKDGNEVTLEKEINL